MKPIVTCMGEALIDFVPIKAAVPRESMPGVKENSRVSQATRELTTEYRLSPGGSIFNVALGVARLGQHAAFAGKLSRDAFGQHLLQTLRANAVDTRFVATTEAQSTVAFAAPQEGDTSFSFYGEGTADTLLTSDDISERFYTETSILHVGSISLLRGSTPSTVLATIGRLGPRALLSFDPNIRAGLVRNEAAYRAILAHLLVRADIVKLSDVDLAWLLPGVPADEALQRLSTQGPALVMITQGKHGILARSSMSSVMHIPAFAVPISDTVGAGDTYCAGVLAQLAERGITSRAALAALPEQELRTILRFAAAAAALNCTRVSANPPTLFEVQQFLSQYPQNGS